MIHRETAATDSLSEGSPRERRPGAPGSLNESTEIVRVLSANRGGNNGVSIPTGDNGARIARKIREPRADERSPVKGTSAHAEESA